MKLTDLKLYGKFLARDKVYTFVCLAGFSISLMFVLILGVYVKQQLTIDSFHEKGDRVYLLRGNDNVCFPSPLGPHMKERYPEVEDYCRIAMYESYIWTENHPVVFGKIMYADDSFFDMFSFELDEGFSASVLDSPGKAVVTRGFANRLFGEEEAMGQAINIYGAVYTVSGIMSGTGNETHFEPWDVIVPYETLAYIWDAYIHSWEAANFGLYLLEKEGMDLPSKTDVILEDLKEALWLYKYGFNDRVEFLPLRDIYFSDVNPEGYPFRFRTNSKGKIYIYMAIAILILAIAVLNYINMTMAQAGFRGKEAAIKKLLGADKGAIFRQLIAESAIMTVASVVMAFLLAFTVEDFFDNALGTKLELAGQIGPGLLLTVMAGGALIALMAGSAPALTISAFRPIEVVKGAFDRKVRSGFSRMLTVLEYTVCMALLICSYFILRQSVFLHNEVPGLNHKDIMIMNYGDPDVSRETMRDFILGLPGVESVSFSMGHPYGNTNGPTFNFHGAPLHFSEIVADAEFFDIYGIKVYPTGIPFTDSTVLVNRAGYNALRPDSVNFVASDGTMSFQVSGMLNDFNVNSLRKAPELIIIRPLSDAHHPWTISVKTGENADLGIIAEKFEERYHMPQVILVDEIIDEWYREEKSMSMIMIVFTILTIVIMTMGIFAMALYTIRRKRKEIAVRKVNGATVGEVLLLLNRDALMCGLLSMLVAIPVAYFYISRWLANFTVQVKITPWPFLACSAGVIILSLISVSWLSLRAAKANPADSLKKE